MYFSARDDEHHLNNIAGIEVDLWHAHGVRNDLNIFLCSAEAFGFVPEAPQPHYCFCTDLWVLPKIYETNEQIAFVLARLQEQPELLALLNSSLAQIAAEASDTSIQDKIYSDLTTVLKQDCD